MNPASWVILAIVVVIVALAVKATFFKKKSKGGCCDTGDAPAKGSCCSTPASSHFSSTDAQPCDGSDYQIKLAQGACGSCTACRESATARNALQPIIKPVA